MIGIVVAHHREMPEFPFPLIKKTTSGKFLVAEYQIKHHHVVVVLAGVGVANAAAATQMLITKYNVTQVWNYGSVGGNKHVNVYDLIAPARIYYHDVFTPWYPLGQTPGEALYYHNSSTLDKSNYLGTGSSFVSTKATIVALKKNLNIDIFDMEAAAIAQICAHHNIPVHVIKCVSDSIGHTNPEDHGDILDRIHQAGIIAFKKTIELISNQ